MDADQKWRDFVTAAPDPVRSALSRHDLRSVILSAFTTPAANAGPMSAEHVEAFLSWTFAAQLHQVGRSPHSFSPSRTASALAELVAGGLVKATGNGFALTVLGRIAIRTGLGVDSVIVVATALGAISAGQLTRMSLIAAAQLTDELRDDRFTLPTGRWRKEWQSLQQKLLQQGIASPLLDRLMGDHEPQSPGAVRARRSLACLRWSRGTSLPTIERELLEYQYREVPNAGPVEQAARRAGDVIEAVIDIAMVVHRAARSAQRGDINRLDHDGARPPLLVCRTRCSLRDRHARPNRPLRSGSRRALFQQLWPEACGGVILVRSGGCSVPPSQRPARTVTGPIVAGDLLYGREVAGFAYAATTESPSRRNDRLLFTGDEGLTTIPEAVVPLSAEEAERHGVPAVDRLTPAARRAAREIDPSLPGRVEELLRRPDAPWRELALPLFDALRRAEHEVWISGGAVRDLLVGKKPAEVKDLDLAGTAPAGRYFELTYLELRALGGSESDMRLSPESLVVWTEPSDPMLAKGALIEYRGLALSGFALPGTGSDLRADAENRDFTVNSLHYDRNRAVVLDPTGSGVDDLCGLVRRLVCCRVSQQPQEAAAIVIRAIKFAARWEKEGVPMDMRTLPEWLDALPPGLWSGLDAATWRGICQDHRDYLSEVDPQRQLEIAQRLGLEAADLIGKLLGVSE
jgi:hypothetical protein